MARRVAELAILLVSAILLGQCRDGHAGEHRTIAVSYWQAKGIEEFPWTGFVDTTVRVDGHVREQRGYPFRPPETIPPANGFPDLSAWRTNRHAPRYSPAMYPSIIRALDSTLSTFASFNRTSIVLAEKGSVQCFPDTSYRISACSGGTVWAMTVGFTGTSSTYKLIHSEAFGILAVCTELGTCFERRWTEVTSSGRDSLVTFRACLDSVYKVERRRTTYIPPEEEQIPQ